MWSITATRILNTFLLLSLFLLPAVSHSAEIDAREILREIDDLWRGQSSRATLEMTVVTEHYRRSMKMQAWSKGKHNSLVRILSPLKEKGTATLKVGKNIYSYLPKTDRTIRLTSGMMLGSWMGSHFTNDDLVKESRRDEDYDTEISFHGWREGKEILEFTLIPKPDAAVVWGKIVLVVYRNGYLPIEEIFYDEDFQSARKLMFSGEKMLGGRMRPSIMRMTPTDKPGEYTELNYRSLELDIEIKDSFFSLNRLKRK